MKPMEHEYRVMQTKRWLPAGPTSAGGERKYDLIQFTAFKKGIVTVAVKDIIDIS